MKPEPVGYYYNGRFSTEKNAPGIGVYGVPVYTAPPQREWVGLTKEEMDYIERMTLDKGDAIRLTAVALQEKNGG